MTERKCYYCHELFDESEMKSHFIEMDELVYQCSHCRLLHHQIIPSKLRVPLTPEARIKTIDYIERSMKAKDAEIKRLKERIKELETK